MVIKKEPAECPRKDQHQRRQRIVIFSHMAVQRNVGAQPIRLTPAAVDAIGVVVPLAADVPVAFAAVHKEAILPFPLAHWGSKPRQMQPFKRKVIYLGGFDPRGARFYHGLLAEQVVAHNATADPAAQLSLGNRRKVGANAGWTVTAATGAMVAEHEFLVWDDLVRRHWINRPPALLWHAIIAYAQVFMHLDPALQRRVPRGSLITLYFPGAAVLGLPLLLVVLGWGLGRHWLSDGLALALALIAGVGLAVWLVKKLHSLWLLRFVIFNDLLARRRVDPAVWDRIDAFAARIEAVFSEDWDEVLFITHSNGSILSVPVMARVLQRLAGNIPPHFALVTLGGCIQLLAARRDAAWFAADLDVLGQGGFCWLDIGSLTDGACVPLVSPCIGRAVERPAGLVQMSPRWFRYCDAAKYAARRRDKYLTHFDYLRRLDRASALDYLGLTAAARPLAASIAAFEAEQHD